MTDCAGACSIKKCKTCYNEYMRVYMLKRYERRRDEAIRSLGGVCVVCGSTTNLEIDHISRNSKLFDIGKALAGWSESRVQAELFKCQILCHEHHKRKTIKENSVEHGEGVSGKKNCRCDLCRPLKSKYAQTLRSKKKQCNCGAWIDKRSTTCRKCNMKKLNSNKLP